MESNIAVLFVLLILFWYVVRRSNKHGRGCQCRACLQRMRHHPKCPCEMCRENMANLSQPHQIISGGVPVHALSEETARNDRMHEVIVPNDMVSVRKLVKTAHQRPTPTSLRKLQSEVSLGKEF